MIEDRFLRRHNVEAMVGLSRSSIYRLMAEGQFPQPIRMLCSRTVVWKASDVQTWMREQEEASRPPFLA